MDLQAKRSMEDDSVAALASAAADRAAPQAAGAEAPPAMEPADHLPLPVGAASAATNAAANLPASEAVGTEVPPTVQVASDPRISAGATSVATNEAANVQASEAFGTETRFPVNPASPSPHPVGAASAATNAAGILPTFEAVGADAHSPAEPSSRASRPVGATSVATNAAGGLPVSESVHTDASHAGQRASNPRSARAAKAAATIPNATAETRRVRATRQHAHADYGPTPHRLGRLAVASLHAELACAPKPGLVTPFDRGSHDDMDAGTFLRSLFALRGYFVAIAAAGAAEAPFAALRQLGIGAERAMLRATGGINTHRGAIFSLGLLVAAAARLRNQASAAPTGEAVCNAVALWREALLDAPLDPRSHGQRMRRAHGVAGVREQAADGFPLLREIALPTLRGALHAGLAHDAAMAQTLLQLIAHTDDLNLLHRGGRDGLRFAQRSARAFLDAGGVKQQDWQQQLARLGDAFVARRLSPGGSADLLACACFLHRQEQP